MHIAFQKYQGAGNDFVLIDNRNQHLPAEAPALYRHLCDRHYGVGADGLILLQNHAEHDFEMRYYNADGSLGSTCGNGARCAVHAAKALGMFTGDQCMFYAYDGPHAAQLLPDGRISVQMTANELPQSLDDGAWFVNTGSPHYVKLLGTTADIDLLDMQMLGSSIRKSPRFAPHGTNVNFVQPQEGGGLRIRTFERGVEAETLACGTGVTAAVLVWAAIRHLQPPYRIAVHTRGGVLEVKHDAESRLFLIGPAAPVFAGEIVTADPLAA